MLLKAVTILRCSEPTISAGLQASKEVKDLGENIHLLKVEKFALEEAKQKLTFDVEKSKEASISKDCRLEEKDRQLEEARNKISKLEKSNARTSGEIAWLKANIVFIENQWRELAFEIKANILAQYQVICPRDDFGEVGLDKHIVNGCIEIAPLSKDGDNSGNEPTTPAIDPQDWVSSFYFLVIEFSPVSGSSMEVIFNCMRFYSPKLNNLKGNNAFIIVNY